MSNLRFIMSVVAGALVGIALAGIIFLAHELRNHRDSDLHTMLHGVVPLNPAEQAALDDKERAFVARRAQIEDQMRQANARLADAIAADPHWTPQVEAASRQVEQAAADLQRATLVHIFEMRAGIEPAHRAAYDKVLIDALRRGSR
jgi:multidrug efflux pump subunit AcrA (membrane-fusion protein)